MSFTITIAKYSHACRSPSLRLSEPMLRRFATNNEPFSIVSGSIYPRATIGELSIESTAKIIKKGDLGSLKQLIDLENVSAWGALSDVETVSSIGSNRLDFGDADVLTAKLRPYLGKTIHNGFSDALGTTEWVPIKVDPERLRPRLLGYLLQSRHYVELSSAFMAGKEHPRINPNDILQLEVPLPPLKDQDALVAALDALNAKCVCLEGAIGNQRDLIDKYFEVRFCLDRNALASAKLLKSRSIKFSDVAGNSDLRFSFKFHAPSVQFALTALRKLSGKRLSDYLSENIVLGASVSPTDYDAESDKLYFSMASIKSWAFSNDSANRISKSYFANNMAKSVAFNDILMARSGEGTIGKVALVPRDVEGICADFTMRIRLDSNLCDPEFARYYFMTEYFQHVVYGEKKGLGNNTNIFPSQLKELPFLDIPLSDQKIVVLEINKLILDQQTERKEIIGLRNTMGEVLTRGLTGKPYTDLLL